MNLPYWSSDKELAQQLNATPKRYPLEETPHIGLLFGKSLPAWLKSNPYDLCWNATKSPSPQEWQSKGHEALLGQLHWSSDKNAAFDPIIREIRETNGYRRTELELTLTHPLRAPASILEPLDKIAGKNPAVLLLHCMGGYRLYGREKVLPCEEEGESLKDYQRRYYRGRNVAEELVKRGYVVMAIDALNFGERTIDAARDPAAFRTWRKEIKSVEEAWPFSKRTGVDEEAQLVRCIEAMGRSWCSLILQDDIRSLDFLSQWPSVDAQRLACCGLSFGGYRSNILAAMDRRVRAAASICWTTSMNDFIFHKPNGLAWFMNMGDLLTRMDVPDIQNLIAPRAFLAISGWQDVLFTPYSMAKAHDKLRRFFTAYGCPEQLGSMIFPSVHEFNLEMQDMAFDFFDKKLL